MSGDNDNADAADPVTLQVRALEALGLEALRDRWRARYGAPPAFRSAPLLRRLLAWRMAGYGGDKNTLKAQAWKLLHQEAVILAIREEADVKLRAGAVLGASVLSEIAEDPFHKDRFKAAQALLDRAGLLVTHQQHVVVEHTTATDQEKIAKIVKMAKNLGLDPATLLGQAGVQYIDAEFSEVEPLALPQPKTPVETF